MSDQNPYVSPNDPNKPDPSPYGNSMAEQKPAAIKVFGILNIVFGVLGVCGMIFSGVVLFAVPKSSDFPNPALDLMQTSGVYRGFMICSLGLGLIFVVVLILSGTNLLNYRKSGRTLALFYGWYGIVATIVGLVMNVVFLYLPMIDQANQQGGPQAAMAMSGLVSGIVGGLAGLIYPVVLLVFMNKQNVINALE